jgi:hypothetical protein
VVAGPGDISVQSGGILQYSLLSNSILQTVIVQGNERFTNSVSAAEKLLLFGAVNQGCIRMNIATPFQTATNLEYCAHLSEISGPATVVFYPGPGSQGGSVTFGVIPRDSGTSGTAVNLPPGVFGGRVLEIQSSSNLTNWSSTTFLPIGNASQQFYRLKIQQ